MVRGYSVTSLEDNVNYFKDNKSVNPLSKRVYAILVALCQVLGCDSLDILPAVI